jgi:glutamate racemase
MIGVFDSGIGGLTVVHALRQQLCDHDMVYFGDTARTPYGTKSAQTVITYVLENVGLLLSHGAKILVMACNTAASVATDVVRQRFNIPIIEVISPAVALAMKSTKKFRVGVIGTRATIQSKAYENKILEMHPATEVYAVACPLLVPLVEEGWLKKPETAMIVKKYLHHLKVRQIDTLILGCTHYPLLKKVIQRKIGPQVHIIDASSAVAAELAGYLAQHAELDDHLGKNRKLRLLVSDITPQAEELARMILKHNVELEHIRC